jgi:SAM-dependent methyltransferase
MPLDIDHLIVCPGCGGALPPISDWPEGEQECPGCRRPYRKVRSIPRFVEHQKYVGNFGFEWNRHRLTQLDSEVSRESEESFRQKTGLGPEDVRGKLVLDVGCGMGRFADVVSRWGGRVVGCDLSSAVEAAQQNLGQRDNVAILQADLFELPFRRESFDIIYSIGVLHHTPSCEKAFRALPQFLRPGGRIAIWVYGTMGPWARFARQYRRVTVRMPPRLLHALCHLAAPLYFLYKIPIVGPALWTVFPISLHPKARWRILDTFDWYSPKYQSLHTYPEVYGWFQAAGLTDARLLDFPVAITGRKPSPDDGVSSEVGD